MTTPRLDENWLMINQIPRRTIADMTDREFAKRCSDLATLEPPDPEEDPDRTRQELLPDADINVLLARFGVDTLTRQPSYGTETDYDIDLQSALAAIDQAKAAWHQLPDDIKQRYGSMRDVLNAIATGNLILDLSRPPKPNGTAEPAPTGNEPPALTVS